MSPSPPVPPSDDDDPVARATDALRRAPVPDGPPPETVDRTLAALREAEAGPVVIPRPRRRTMLTMLLKAAGAILAAAAGAMYFAAFPPAAARSEFTDVALKLRDAQTLSLHHSQTMTIAGMPGTINARVLYKVPGLVRNELEPAAQGISIMDLNHGKVLILNPTDKSAMLLQEPPGPEGGPAPKRDAATMMIEDMRRLAGKDNEPAGEKVIGDVRARGFLVKEGGQELTVWVDPQKKLPVLIEFSGRTGNIDFRGTFSEIQLDPPLDDALFRLDPPEGYTLRKVNARLHMTPEEAVARVLRNYTRASGGRFPARLDDLDDYVKVVSAANKKAMTKEAEARTKEAKIVLEPSVFEDGIAGAILAGFCQQKKDQYGYKPDGAKLGDAGTIVFWYKPDGATRYKAVYGDLHIGDVTQDELPKK